MIGTLEYWKVVKVVETLLLVDENENTRQCLKLILELGGFRVVEALNGIEGLQILGEWGQDIQLALCTEDLPDMTSGQWRGQVRFLGPDIPSLILSDRDREEITNMPVGPKDNEQPMRSANVTRLLERIRMVLDEQFFKMRVQARASAA
jgi:DNA-binding response OmpR family regulator